MGCPLKSAGSTDSDFASCAEVLLRAPKDQNGNPDKQQRIEEFSKCSQVLVDDILSCCIKIIEEAH